jgi:hypothetical protein
MDKISRYRELIKSLLSEQAEQMNRHSTAGIETDVAFDEERDHYMLLKVGWWPQGRVRGNTIYVRLKNGKFWIEEDWTEEGIATALLEAGVPNEDIVLAFQPPEMRPYTEFAVA